MPSDFLVSLEASALESTLASVVAPAGASVAAGFSAVGVAAALFSATEVVVAALVLAASVSVAFGALAISSAENPLNHAEEVASSLLSSTVPSEDTAASFLLAVALVPLEVSITPSLSVTT